MPSSNTVPRAEQASDFFLDAVVGRGPIAKLTPGMLAQLSGMLSNWGNGEPCEWSETQAPHPKH